MTPADWREHFHPFWERFRQARQSFDPDKVLTPGQGLF
jgi:FAD/FMN-containing dehydrogenase